MRQEGRGGGGRVGVDAARAAARTARDGFAETLAYTEFPPEHWRRIRTNNGIERINWEIGRRTRAVGTFPDSNSALMLVTARLKCVVEHEWGKRRDLDMPKLEEMDELKGKAEGKKRTGMRTAKSICERILTVPNSRSTTIRRSWHKYHSSLFQPLRTSRNEESKQIGQLSNQLDVLFFRWQFPNVKTTKQ